MNAADITPGTRSANRPTMPISSIVVLLTACGTTTTTPLGGPRGLRAHDHLDVARQQDEQARELSIHPAKVIVGGPDARDQPIAMPWYRSWDTATEHERLAAIHRSKAAELQVAYDEACGGRPISEVSVSPLQRHGIGGWNTSTGVILYLAPSAGPPDQLLAAIRCHRAWMMLAPSGMDDCPLDLSGLELDAKGDTDEITVLLTVKDRALVPELQRRAARDLEAAAGLGRSVHKKAEHRP